MVAEAGLRRPPTLLVDPYRDVPSGRVFGCFPYYYLRLNLSVLRGSEAVRRAIVHHELAHLRNGDVDITGLTIAAGRVLPIAVFAPLVLVGFSRQSPYMGQVWWRLIVVLVLVIVVRAAVIRSREHYADVAASNCENTGDESGFLAKAFPEPQPSTPQPGQVRQLVRQLATLRRMHPSLQRRSSVVADPGMLLTIGALEAVAIGFTMGLSIIYLNQLFNLSLGGNVYSAFLAAFLLCLPAIGTLMAGLWRATLRALATRVELPTATAAGVGLWAGLLLSQFLMRPFGAHWPLTFVIDPTFGVIDALGLLLGCLLFTRWSVGAAAAWLPTARGRSLRPALAAGQFIGALAFSGALAIWLTLPIPGSRSQYAAPLALLLILAGPYTLVPILLATAFPLSAALRRAGLPTQRPLWLDTQEVTALPAPQLRIAAVLIPPIAALGIAAVVELLLRGRLLILADHVAAAHRWGTFDSSFVLPAMEIAPAIIIIPLVVALTSGPASAGLGPAHAVLAATLSSFLTVFAVAEYTTGLACGAQCGGFPGGWKLFVLNLPLVEGATLCLALLTLALIYLIRGPLRRLRSSRQQWPANEPTTDRPTRRPAWPLRWTFIPLILAMSFTVSYGWAVTNLLPASMRPPTVAVNVPPYPTNTPVPTAVVVCNRMATLHINITSPNQILTREAQLASTATASDSPALRAFGASLTQGLQNKDPDRITSRALQAIQRYCGALAIPTAQI
jgi:hypothetical protein